MNFKKLAIVAALLASSSAFAVTEIDTTAYDSAETANTDLAVAELAAPATWAGDGNFAVIFQEVAGSLAYIDQLGANNFASVAVATNDAGIGLIYQVGDNNIAAIYQH